MRRIATLAAGLALALPGSAAAASSSTCQAYSPQLCNSVTTHTTAGSSSESTLPFTGLDVALLAGGGGTMLLAGFGVRRLSRRLN